MEYVNVVGNSLNTLALDLVNVIPMLLIALVIWYIGVYLLGIAVKVIRKADIPKTKLDNKTIDTVAVLVNGVGRFLLVLIVLDYLGIGRTVVGAIANGVTFAIAIALGLAFGKALEGDAQKVVSDLKRFLSK